jgi:hypothetical protein
MWHDTVGSKNYNFTWPVSTLSGCSEATVFSTENRRVWDICFANDKCVCMFCKLLYYIQHTEETIPWKESKYAESQRV